MPPLVAGLSQSSLGTLEATVGERWKLPDRQLCYEPGLSVGFVICGSGGALVSPPDLRQFVSDSVLSAERLKQSLRDFSAGVFVLMHLPDSIDRAL